MKPRTKVAVVFLVISIGAWISISVVSSVTGLAIEAAAQLLAMVGSIVLLAMRSKETSKIVAIVALVFGGIGLLFSGAMAVIAISAFSINAR